MTTVETSSGKLRGSCCQGVHSFRGVPYGAYTGGANRFQPPTRIAWTGVREALACGPRAPQDEPPTSLPYLTWIRDTGRMGENCLVLNIFTASMEEGRRRPVMVYLHGGGFTIGSGGAQGIDGSNLARRDVVVVTLNHRLNLFGFLHLGDADGGRYGQATNVGLLDLVAALEWVRDNIARFGGDPHNVTIFGQSGGGSKVAALMAMPRACGLFHKAIVQSASSALAMASLEQAERNADFFLRTLGLDRCDGRRLHDLPVETLLAARVAAVQAAGQVDDYRPVVDGAVLPSQPFDEAAVRLSAHVPLLAGWCEHEQRLAFAPTPAVYGWSEQQALAATARALDVPQPEAARVLATYRNARPKDSPGDLFTQVFGDQRYRRTVTTLADRQFAHGGAPVYQYLLAWQTPVQGGLLRAPHTLCIPFVFGNVDLATGITGTGADRYRLQDEMAGAWVAFAHGGDPNHAGLPRWTRHEPGGRPTLVFDRDLCLVADPLRDERLALEALPRYRPAIGEARRAW